MNCAIIPRNPGATGQQASLTYLSLYAKMKSVMKPSVETVRTSLDVPRNLHRKVHEAAARKGCSARQLILAAIETAVREAPAKAGKRLDLRSRPLLPRTGKPIDLSNDQIYDFIEFP
ncbi:MAG: hypothetical protein ACLQVN_23515 [Bryobacteraceae bacterium]